MVSWYTDCGLAVARSIAHAAFVKMSQWLWARSSLFYGSAELAVLIFVPDLWWLIRSHMLEQTVKTVETKGQSPQIKSNLHHITKNRILYSHNTSPQIPPVGKRSAVCQKAQAVKQTGGTEMAEMSRTSTIHSDHQDTKYEYSSSRSCFHNTDKSFIHSNHWVCASPPVVPFSSARKSGDFRQSFVLSQKSRLHRVLFART